ncbi:MAG: hypothetical protein IKJ25_02870, partial [Clostridia bacterium]|nr:hypothetical protein [Clostridia bacterium]
MKRKITAAILLVIAFAFVLSSCRSIRDNVIVANDVEIGYVGHRDKDGKTYVQDYYTYMIDLNSRSYSVLGKSDEEPEEQNKQYAFEYYMHPCGEYFADI